MAQSAIFPVLMAAVLINILSYCSAENVYCVTPNANSCPSCPRDSIRCATLSEYAQEAELYFTSNTTMVFLPGDHVLDRNITVANVARLTMHGGSGSSSDNIATVVRNGSVGLIFISMVKLKIYSLAFISSSGKNGTPSPIKCGLFLYSTQYAELVNCSFNYNLGSALVVINTNITLAGNSEFTHNRCESCGGGGAITAFNSSLTFTGNATFLENKATYHRPHSNISGGGAIYASENVVLCFTGTSNFINNTAHMGGALYALVNVVFSFIGTSNFINNSAYQGGAIFTLDNTVLTFNGANKFIKNSAHKGGAILALKTTVLSFNGANSFINNSAGFLGGAIYTLDNTALSFKGTTSFINNSADYGYAGGAVCASKNTVLSFSGTTNFINNSAHSLGGAIFTIENTELDFKGTTNFINNSAGYLGGAIFTRNIAVLDFKGNTNFINNSNYGYGGGAIFTSTNIIINFSGTNNFINNSAVGSGGTMYTSGNTSLSFNGTSNFIGNSAGYYGGAIFTYTSTALTFNGTINFTNNGHNRSGVDALNKGTNLGGGVYMGLECTISILPNTNVYWVNNHATLGGAICVFDGSPLSYCMTHVPNEECFFQLQLPGQNLSGIDVQLVFINNSADIAGNVLYGGAIDHCKLIGLDSHTSGEVFGTIFHINTDDNTTSNISSNPLKVCHCENNLPNCSESEYNVPYTVYPGETVHISVVVVGQRDGIIPSTVRSVINQPESSLRILDSQYLQQANACTCLNYTVFSLSQYVTIELHAEASPCVSDNLEVSVNLSQTCPPGFNISKTTKSCVCEQRLLQYSGTHQCNITNGITRDSSRQFWVGYNNQSHELILHPHCPFDYCVGDTIVFFLSNADIQCAYNRSGLLCGHCKKGYSLVLGTSHCKKCTNSHLAFLIPFAVMGVALVLLLLVCKLTVATGTLSGLVFYANIVGVNRTIFLPANPLLSVFIAWLNLDFGIETCFYNGMDAYSKTWLQFVFPVFIWVIVGLIIVVSHYSYRFASLLGNNPVSVLATLILLSYTKILRTLIAVIYVTYLEYPTYKRSVWLYDANIGYLHGKHIPLFLVAVLVFFFLFLPYTLLLLFGQWLQAISHLRLFSWVNSARLKPFMDSYHAPYKAKYRYWPGLLLVLRFVLLLVFAFEFNPQQDRASINLLAIQVGTGTLVIWAWVCGGVYRNWCLDALEGSFALNLIILASSTMYTHHMSHSKDQLVGRISVSIALATFVGILTFQLLNVTGIAQYLKRKCTAVSIRNVLHVGAEMKFPTDTLPDRLVNPGEYEPPFHTSQQHATAEPTEEEQLINETQRLIAYGSNN